MVLCVSRFIGAKYTLQQVTKKMDMLNAVQLAELGNEATDNAGEERNPLHLQRYRGLFMSS